MHPQRPDVTLPANAEGYFGAMRTGKSASMKQRLQALNPQRVMIFDPKHEYAPNVRSETEAAFYQAVEKFRYGGRMAIMRPPFDDAQRIRWFDRFCKTALAVGRHFGKGAAVVVADELQTVTTAHSAPAGWRELVQTGCSWGLHILAASQRPATIDKHFWSQASYLRTFRLNFKDDADSLGGALLVPARDVIALGHLEYIERDLSHGKPSQRGKVTFKSQSARSIDRS